MRHYLTDKCRLVTGLESFLPQGLQFGNRMDSLAERSSDVFLCGLAGNAFHVWVAAVLFSSQCALAECARSVGGSRSSGEAADTYQVQGEPRNGPTEAPLPCGLDLVWCASSGADTDQGPVSDLGGLG